jgi:acetate---CoA ligase (ADP-forming)
VNVRSSSSAVSDATLVPLFAPRGIAVVGASRNPGKLGASLARSLHGFAGRGGHLALVNGRDATMHSTVPAAMLAGPVDLAMICVPASACPAVLAEAAEAGVRAAVICGGGFAETGGSGAALQQELAAVVARTGIRLLGPNTSGFFSPGAGLTASFVPAASLVPAGHVAVVAASGGMNHAVAFLLADAGHGVSLAVGLGNSVDVNAADVLDHLASDPQTAAIALHVESVTDGSRLISSISALTPHKPVVALVVGRHDIGAFAASHTGALATSWRTTRSALAQAGAVLVGDERELVDAVGALAVTRARPGRDPGVGVVTAQAGPGLLLLDDLRGRAADVPELTPATQARLAALLPPLTFQCNPVDTGRPGPDFGQLLAAVAIDPAIDVIAAYALHEPDAVDLVAAVQEAQVPGVPIVLGVGGTGPEPARIRRSLLAAGVVAAVDPRGVAAAAAALLADARARCPSTAPPAVRRASGEHIGAGPFDEGQAKDLLSRLGIATPARHVCASRASAHAALAELASPAAVKLLDSAVLHKTDVGGVHLSVRTAADLDTALDALDSAGAVRYLVEAMAPPGVDLVVGARRDRVFGPIVLLGLGGTTAEVLADVCVRLAPLSEADAAAMARELAGRALLDGWRGGPVLDSAELGRVVAALGDLIAANPQLAEAEINPLRLTAEGLIALDAVFITREAAGAQPHQ